MTNLVDKFNGIFFGYNQAHKFVVEFGKIIGLTNLVENGWTVL